MTVHRYYECRCGHVWMPRRLVAPVKCPLCKKLRPTPSTETEYIQYLAWKEGEAKR